MFNNIHKLTLVAATASLVACGTPTDEETAQASANAVGTMVSALNTSADLGNMAAGAQNTDADPGEDPNAPSAGGDQAPCPQSWLTDGALRVEFGAGCQVGAQTISGAYEIRLSLYHGLGVTLTFDGLTTNGVRNDGEMSLSLGQRVSSTDIVLRTTNGTSVDDITLSGTLEKVSDSASQLDGRGSYDDGSGASSFDARGIQLVAGQCWADAGSIDIQLPSYPAATITFNSSTPATGNVEVSVGVFSQTIQLPAIGNCPGA